MPLETSPQSRFPYFLAAFDAKGHERTDDRDGLMSAKIIGELRAQPVTDVFLLSHGWQGEFRERALNIITGSMPWPHARKISRRNARGRRFIP